MANYILICMDGTDADGRLLRAAAVARNRIGAKLWPIYSGTRNRTDIKVGDRFVVYIGGQREHAQEFVSTGFVAGMELPSESRRADSPNLNEVGPPAHAWLRLMDIRDLEPAVSVRPLLDSLSFVPKNRKRWGVALMGGVRRISDDDLKLILAVPRGALSLRLPERRFF